MTTTFAETPGLACLLGEEEARRFLSEAWPNRAAFVAGPLERLRGIADVPELMSLERMLELPRDRVVVQLLSLEGKQLFTHATSNDECLTFYNAGHTLEIIGLESESLDVRKRAIEAELGHPPGGLIVNGFASRRSKGARTHFDAQENFAVQLRGTKKWRYAPNQHVAYPSYNFTIDRPEISPPALALQAPDGFPDAMPDDAVTCELVPGSVLFLPRGYWHDAETEGAESLHLQINCEAPSYRKVLEFMMSTHPIFESLEWRSLALESFRGGRMNPQVFVELGERLERTASVLREAAKELARGDELGEEALQQYLAQMHKKAQW